MKCGPPQLNTSYFSYLVENFVTCNPFLHLDTRATGTFDMSSFMILAAKKIFDRLWWWKFISPIHWRINTIVPGDTSKGDSRDTLSDRSWFIAATVHPYFFLSWYFHPGGSAGFLLSWKDTLTWKCVLYVPEFIDCVNFWSLFFPDIFLLMSG